MDPYFSSMEHTQTLLEAQGMEYGADPLERHGMEYNQTSSGMQGMEYGTPPWNTSLGTTLASLEAPSTRLLALGGV